MTLHPPLRRRERRPSRVSDNGDLSPSHPYRGIRWSVSYVALLVYLVSIVTYQIPIGDIAMAVALLGLFFEPRGIRFNGPLWFFLAFLAWGWLSWLGTPWPAVVIGEVVVIGKLFLIALVALTVLDSRPRIRLFIILFVLCFALYPARGTIVNYFVAGYSVFGRAVWNFIYANSNDLGALALLQFSLAAGLAVTERNQLFRWGALLAIPVLGLVILLTQSRGVFLGLSMFGLLAIAGGKRKARIAVVTAVMASGALLVLPDSALERFAMLSSIGSQGTAALSGLDDMGSAEQRWAIWGTAARIIGDNPVTGVGVGGYPAANAAYSPELGARDTHSTYLNVAAEMGLPGLLIFFGILGSTLLTSERIRRRLKAVRPASAQQIYFMELGLLGFLVAGVFGSYARLTFLYLHVILLFVLAIAHDHELRRSRTGTSISKVA